MANEARYCEIQLDQIFKIFMRRYGNGSDKLSCPRKLASIVPYAMTGHCPNDLTIEYSNKWKLNVISLIILISHFPIDKVSDYEYLKIIISKPDYDLLELDQDKDYLNFKFFVDSPKQYIIEQNKLLGCPCVLM